jgi:hypothetical protein
MVSAHPPTPKAQGTVRIFPFLSTPLSPWCGRAVVRLLFPAAGLTLGAVLGALLVLWPQPASRATGRPASAPPALMTTPPGTAEQSPAGLKPLGPGLKFPPLTSRWLNGPRTPPLPPVPGRVTVVDVWALW